MLPRYSVGATVKIDIMASFHFHDNEGTEDKPGTTGIGVIKSVKRATADGETWTIYEVEIIRGVFIGIHRPGELMTCNESELAIST